MMARPADLVVRSRPRPRLRGGRRRPRQCLAVRHSRMGGGVDRPLSPFKLATRSPRPRPMRCSSRPQSCRCASPPTTTILSPCRMCQAPFSWAMGSQDGRVAAAAATTSNPASTGSLGLVLTAFLRNNHWDRVHRGG